jgi:hypothetical protein
MPRRLILPAVLLLALCACAGTPYRKDGASKEQADADYQDCYSEAARQHFTPEIQAHINKAARECMKQRGYHSSFTFNPW